MAKWLVSVLFVLFVLIIWREGSPASPFQGPLSKGTSVNVVADRSNPTKVVKPIKKIDVPSKAPDHLLSKKDPLVTKRRELEDFEKTVSDFSEDCKSTWRSLHETDLMDRKLFPPDHFMME